MSNHIFISYSREDKPWLDKLVPLLKQAKLQAGVDYWTDERIQVSEDWNEEIEKALEQSAAAILLVSGHFLSSRFIKEKEVMAFLRKSIPIFPLLISECLWRKVDWLQKKQFFPKHPVVPLDKIPSDEHTGLLLDFVELIIDKMREVKTVEKPAKAGPERFLATGATETEPPPRMLSSILANVDIRHFTLMRPEAQHHAIRALWKAIEQLLPVNSAAKIIHHEDGAVFVFSTASTTHQSVMHFTRDLIRLLQSEGVDLRAVLHQGYVTEVTSSLLKETIVFGTDVNDCRKLCAFSDKGQFVVSAPFLDEWEKMADINFAGLTPTRGKPPFKVMLKEDRHIGIRIAGLENGEPPQKIRFLELVDGEIWLILEDIADLLVDELRKLGLRNARTVCLPRVSFLTPVRRNGMLFLTCSLRSEKKERKLSPSSTFYQVEPPGAGPCGRAFVSGEIQIAAGFPKDSSEYIKRWNQVWGLTEEDVKGFTRRSRAVMSIPVGITPNLGVLCIDSMHPLATVPKINSAWLQEFCEGIRADFNTELSALWMHRIQY